MACVGLISCVSRKRASPTKARDLYVSPLFVKSRQYVGERCDRWYILSAKYGLVQPDEVIAPYDETLKAKSRTEREKWAAEVWSELASHVRRGDQVVVLAGLRYREFLMPMIERHGCQVSVPLEGKSIGRQLQWLSRHLCQPTRYADLERLYASLRKLEKGLGGKRLMSACSGHEDWPDSRVYLFFEPGEHRSDRDEPRVVRVGTHRVSRESKSTFWHPLRTHRGNADGLGNHRGSVFRLHVGAALAAKDAELVAPSWGKGQAGDLVARKSEEPLERAVSQHIGTMSVLWLDVEDPPGPASDRAYLERNLIGLLVGRTGPADPPSRGWLGLFSPDDRIRVSGLWNLDFLTYSYTPDFLAVLDEYVSITLGQKPQPKGSIAPNDWHRNREI